MENEQSIRWTEDDVNQRLDEVREILLAFLRERTRLDWFKHKLRWRLSRRYIWPGAPDDFKQRLNEDVERDVGVEAFLEHLDKRKQEISQAIERYNKAVTRWMEQETGKRVDKFDEETLAALREQKIGFEGIRDELLRCGKHLTKESGPDLLPDLLSLRLAILTEEAREQVFAEVAATLASRAAEETPDMSYEERQALAFEIDLRLRSFDRFHVASLLSESYQEARRLMEFDSLLERFQQLRTTPTPDDPFFERRLETTHQVLLKELSFLEKIYPRSKDTHDVENAILRQRSDLTSQEDET